jgi:hypothetical protein
MYHTKAIARNLPRIGVEKLLDVLLANQPDILGLLNLIWSKAPEGSNALLITSVLDAADFVLVSTIVDARHRTVLRWHNDGNFETLDVIYGEDGGFDARWINPNV